MEKANEYKRLIKCLDDRRKHDPNLNGNTVPKIIHDANQKALDQLEPDEQKHIKRLKKFLMANYSNLGEAGALELIAAASFYMKQKEVSQ